MTLHFLDITETGTVVHGDGLRELFLSAEQWTDGLAEAFKGVDDVAYCRINGERETLGPTGGDYNVLVTPDGDLFWVEPDCRHYRRRGDDTRYEIPIPGGTTQGMAYWDAAAREIVWMDTVLRDPRPIARAYRHRGYTFGLDPDADRVLAEKPDGSLWVVAEAYTPIGAKGRLTPHGAVCVISLPSRPVSHREFPAGEAPYVVPEAAWQPWTPPVILPAPAPVQRPPLRRVTPRRHLHLFAEPQKPAGTGTWSFGPGSVRADGTKLPVMEGIGDPRRTERDWIETVPADHPMHGVWWTRDENFGDWHRAEAEFEARQRKTTLEVYSDRPRFGAIDDAVRLRREANVVRCAQQCYSGPDHQAALEVIRESLRALARESLTCDLILRCDATTSWPADEVDAMLPAAIDLANEFPDVVTGLGVLHCGSDEENDWPANRLAWWERLLADNPAPPVIVTPTPTPIETPAGSVVTKPWTRDDGTNGHVPEWVAVAGGIVAIVKYAKPIGRAIAWPFKKLFGK